MSYTGDGQRTQRSSVNCRKSSSLGSIVFRDIKVVTLDKLYLTEIRNDRRMAQASITSLCFDNVCAK